MASAASSAMAGFGSKIGFGHATLPLLSTLVLTAKTRISARLCALGDKSSRLYTPGKISIEDAAMAVAASSRRSFREIRYR